MRAKDPRIVRQSGQAGQAVPHLLGRAFEEPSAAQRKQGVAHESDAACGVEIGDVAQRVAAGLDHPKAGFAEFDHVAARDCSVERGDARHLGRPDDRRAGGGLQFGVAAGMVRMPVGIEDEIQLPPLPFQGGENGAGVRRVDGRGLAGGFVAREEAIVVLQAGELADNERHGGAPETGV